MISNNAIEGLKKLYTDFNLEKTDVLSIMLNHHSYYPHGFNKNQIHIYRYGFEKCNVAVTPHTKGYLKKATYKIYNGEIFEIFQLIKEY